MTTTRALRLAALVLLPMAAILCGEYYGGQLAQFLVLGAVTGALALT